MTEEQIQEMEADLCGWCGPDELKDDVRTLIAEVRRLQKSLDETHGWIPLQLASDTVRSGQDSIVSKMALLLEANGHRAAADLVRRAWSEATK